MQYISINHDIHIHKQPMKRQNKDKNLKIETVRY